MACGQRLEDPETAAAPPAATDPNPADTATSEPAPWTAPATDAAPAGITDGAAPETAAWSPVAPAPEPPAWTAPVPPLLAEEPPAPAVEPSPPADLHSHDGHTHDGAADHAHEDHDHPESGDHQPDHTHDGLEHEPAAESSGEVAALPLSEVHVEPQDSLLDDGPDDVPGIADSWPSAAAVIDSPIPADEAEADGEAVPGSPPATDEGLDALTEAHGDPLAAVGPAAEPEAPADLPSMESPATQEASVAAPTADPVPGTADLPSAPGMAPAPASSPAAPVDPLPPAAPVAPVPPITPTAPVAPAAGPQSAAVPPNVAVTAAASPSTPNGLAVAAARLTSDARNAVRTTLVVVAALLEAGEQVEAVSAGVLSGAPAVLALTDRRVMAVNQQDWAPIVTSFTVDQQLDVQAWEDAAAATVVLAAAGRSATLESITDRTPAYDLVQRIRTRTGR